MIVDEASSGLSVFLTGIAIGLSIGLFQFRLLKNEDAASKQLVASQTVVSCTSSSEEEFDEETDEELEDQMDSLRLKMVFVIRQVTPKLTSNAVASMVSQTALQLLEKRLKNYSSKESTSSRSAEHRLWYRWWRRLGCAKITLKCDDNEALVQSMMEKAEEMRLPLVAHRLSTSPALSGVEGGSAGEIVVIGFGPAPSHELNEITGTLKLLS